MKSPRKENQFQQDIKIAFQKNIKVLNDVLAW